MSEINQNNYVGIRNFKEFVQYAEEAKQHNHAYFIGDIPVTKELLKFFKSFKDKRYSIVPCVDFTAVPVWPSNDSDSVPYYVWNKIGITFPDTKEWRVGSLFVNAPTNDIKEYVYGVRSPKIKNEKFNQSSDGYTTRKSTDMAKALKVAFAYLKPLSINDLREESRGHLGVALANLRAPAREKILDKFSIEKSNIIKEVAHMIASGYAPLTQEFNSAMELLKSEGEELKRLQDYKPRLCFVWLRPDSMMYKYSDDDQPIELTNPNDIPEDLRNKIAVLQIASVKTPLVDVGVRLSDSTYWIFV
jgi:hypothetical protein